MILVLPCQNTLRPFLEAHNLSLVQQLSISFVIAPHGITDVIHAKKYKKMNELLFTYCSTFIASTALFDEYFPSLFIVFFISSVMHFNHDLNLFIYEKRTNYLQSAILLLYFINYPLPFLNYMNFIHVPLHYKKSWPFIKSNISEVSALILIVGTVSLVTLHFPSSFATSTSIGIILGHIIYEELFVHNKHFSL